ncbi:nucleotide sugar dehydrogenase [Caldisalinibacter kiritimatiensis]|uniref:UDP-glucose dehydrogenase n=1 Tax=Caldisalinibacter kiritimatiensis TaxID=1304284 RepID=R1CMP8_9FIRM|nr:nucleotide sugar dehydrogenase [Caldisalinibacter kiritimatiensis]EOC99970.1 UDP-glucose dehydrogenase [Caldisalinibacter kiritimatiensis]
MKKICVIGLGYIGLPTSVLLAFSGWKVTGVDINEKIVSYINKGKAHINEANINWLLQEVIVNERLIAKTTPREADVFIIAVPTPINNEFRCNLSYVVEATKSILPYLQKGNTIIIESTIPPGTTEDIVKPIIENESFEIGKDIFLAYCPERVLPGHIIEELIYNNRIVGGCTEKCGLKAKEVYNTFVKGDIFITDAKTAEMTKLVENTYRDVNIAFSNEITKVCNTLNINVYDVINFANMHPRVSILNPGPGVGGHCLAVDPYFIIEKAPNESQIISLSREINNSMPDYVVKQVDNLLKNNSNPKVAVFGITYKGNVNDLRESPAIKISNILRKKGYEVNAYDPLIKENEYNVVSLNTAIKDADILLILADHDEFKFLNYEKIAKYMNSPIIFDTKHIIDEETLSNEIQLINFGNLYFKN